MKFIILYPKKREKAITGGHKYEENLKNNFIDLGHIFNCDYLQSHERNLSKLFSPIKSLLFYKKLSKFDGIFFNSTTFFYFLPLALLLKLTRKNVFIIHHHFLYLEFSGIKKWIYKWSEFIFLKSAKHIISPSPYIDIELKKRKFNNILLWQIPFEQIKSEVKLEPIPGNLLFIGTIEERKGVHLLLQSLVRLKKAKLNFNLRIIGKTINHKYEERLREFIRIHNLSVTFLGYVSNETKQKVMRTSDIFVFPSLLEGFGIVLGEAQSYGLPIVCFNNSAMPLTVHHDKNGLLCKNMDIEEMAENIKKILTNRVIRAQLSQQALKDSKKFVTNDILKERILMDLNSIY